MTQLTKLTIFITFLYLPKRYVQVVLLQYLYIVFQFYIKKLNFVLIN